MNLKSVFGTVYTLLVLRMRAQRPEVTERITSGYLGHGKVDTNGREKTNPNAVGSAVIGSSMVLYMEQGRTVFSSVVSCVAKD